MLALTATRPASASSRILHAQGYLVKVEDHTLSIGKCQRSKTTVEPLISTQWFCHMKPLAEKAIEAVQSGRTTIRPENWEKIYFDWMNNIRDWCISRQLWWGHRIPAWICQDCQEINVSREDPTTCINCGKHEPEAGRRRARHLVQLRPLAVLHARMA